MSWGHLDPEDLMCPNGHGAFAHALNRDIMFCTACGYEVTGLELKREQHRNLKQMIADKAIGREGQEPTS